MIKRFRINWFRLNRELHRDLGYLCIGLTIVFAISGIALNHIDDWNPNYIVNRFEKALLSSQVQNEKLLNQRLLARFRISEPVKASYWEAPKIYKVFFKGGSSLTADFNRQRGVYEKVSPRAVFKQFNQLHLNKSSKGWIIFSDIYAGLLLFLALSSLFMVKGKYSPWRKKRGWLLLVGGLIPAIFIFI
ncbi:MAG: PepSY-associated TM helix domain-containing protein [Colwellia sp.]